MSDPVSNGRRVMVPLDEYARDIARTAARDAVSEVLAAHKAECAISDVQEEIERDIRPRLRAVEITQSRLIGFLLGAGLLGGGAGALVSKMVGG